METVESDLIFGLVTTVTGLVVVFSALVGVALVVIVFGKLDPPEANDAGKQPKPAGAASGWQRLVPSALMRGRKTARSVTEPQPALPSTGNPGAALPATQGVPPEVVAVIMAAVAAAIDRPIRVQRIRYRSQPVESGWSRQGRISIMTSHLPKR